MHVGCNTHCSAPHMQHTTTRARPQSDCVRFRKQFACTTSRGEGRLVGKMFRVLCCCFPKPFPQAAQGGCCFFVALFSTIKPHSFVIYFCNLYESVLEVVCFFFALKLHTQCSWCSCASIAPFPAANTPNLHIASGSISMHFGVVHGTHLRQGGRA